MTDHTPGPWHCGEKFVGSVDGFKVYGYPISANGQAIARVHAGTPGRHGFGNEEANARLIAAAPEMLAALHAIESAFHNPKTLVRAAMDALEHARNAIAKAEGCYSDDV